jgi:hypothetical protein
MVFSRESINHPARGRENLRRRQPGDEDYRATDSQIFAQGRASTPLFDANVPNS